MVEEWAYESDSQNCLTKSTQVYIRVLPLAESALSHVNVGVNTEPFVGNQVNQVPLNFYVLPDKQFMSFTGVSPSIFEFIRLQIGK
jgi:hypothetical protein